MSPGPVPKRSGGHTAVVVAQDVRAVTAAEATLYGAIIAGVFGTLLGVALGLFGERWVRSWGDVRCNIRWYNSRGAGGVDSPGGVEVQERRLEITFLNRKDVPVTVWEMQVVFYRGISRWTMRNARTSSSRAPEAGRGRSSW